MKEKHLDPNKIDVAILTGDEPMEASTLANPYYASALVSAYNDYQIDHWLPKDSRFMGSIVIAPQDPNLAAKEIRRLGDHPRMAQVLASQGSQSPMAILSITRSMRPAPKSDCPSPFISAVRWRQLECHCARTHNLLLGDPCDPPHGGDEHVASMIAHGVFEKWPDLFFVVIECGVAWVPSVLWRLDQDYKALRKETPWLKMLPSEYFRRNIRFSTQPLERPDNLQHLWSILEAMDGENTCCLHPTIPHWDYDDVKSLHLPPEWKPKIFGLNALEVYKRIPAPAKTRAA